MPQGYVLIEFPTLEEAKAAVEGVNGTKLLDQTISVDFAFVRRSCSWWKVQEQKQKSRRPQR
jgi:RNA recognition motif-containing protein